MGLGVGGCEELVLAEYARGQEPQGSANLGTCQPGANRTNGGIPAQSLGQRLEERGE
jgi:hypothetical protein